MDAPPWTPHRSFRPVVPFARRALAAGAGHVAPMRRGADAAAPATLEILNELLDVNTAKIDSVSADVAVVE